MLSSVFQGLCVNLTFYPLSNDAIVEKNILCFVTSDKMVLLFLLGFHFFLVNFFVLSFLMFSVFSGTIIFSISYCFNQLFCFSSRRWFAESWQRLVRDGCVSVIREGADVSAVLRMAI